jgi:hypothetical protein
MVLFRAFCDGEVGAVEIESEWTARRRKANKMLVSGQSASSLC